MKTIAIADIAVSPTRQRRHFDPVKMQEFAAGIAERGLLHAIILREERKSLGTGLDYKTTYTLVCGERRLRAIESLAALANGITYEGAAVPLGHVPYTLFTDLSPLAAEEAELEENIHREDLTWQERSAATLRLQTLRTAQAAVAGAPAPTVADLSTEMRGHPAGFAYESTRNELLVARHLHNPEVAAAKNVGDAIKVLRREEAAERAKSLGESVGRTFSSDIHRLLNTDSLAWMKEAAAEQFDVILTDPPYGMGADEFGDSNGLAAGKHGYTDDYKTWLACSEHLAIQGYRICKPQAHAYIFCDIDSFWVLRDMMTAQDWWVFRTPLIWHKPSAMRAPWPEHGPQRKYECILFAVKGKRKVRRMAADLIAFSPDTNLGHAAQKPVALFEDLLSRSAWPGDAVFDPFGGSGPIIEAAHAQKLRATYIEQDPASYGLAVARLRRLKAAPELPL